MTPWFLRVVRNALAGLCLLVGLAGLVLPLLPGWYFLIAGLILVDFPRKREFVLRVERRLRQNKQFAQFARHPWLAKLRRRLRGDRRRSPRRHEIL